MATLALSWGGGGQAVVPRNGTALAAGPLGIHEPKRLPGGLLFYLQTSSMCHLWSRLCTGCGYCVLYRTDNSVCQTTLDVGRRQILHSGRHLDKWVG